MAMDKLEIENIEIDLFLEAIFRRYGYDFRNYARASINRRARHLLAISEYKNISDMIPRLMSDEAFFSRVVLAFSITVTEMFRDPEFYKGLREKVVESLIDCLFELRYKLVTYPII